MKNKINNTLNKIKLKHITIILILLLFGFLIEFLSSNIDYLSIDDKGSFNIDKYEIKQEIIDNRTFQIITVQDIDKYVDEFVLNLEQTFSGIPINIYNVNNEEKEKIFQDNIFTEFKDNIFSLDREINDLEITVETSNELSVSKIEVRNNIQFNLFRFILILLIEYFIIKLAYIIKYKKKINLPNLFLEISLTFGILMCIINPVYNSWDEKEHFSKAYNLSRGNIIMRSGEEVMWPDNAYTFLRVGGTSRSTNGYENFIKQYKQMNELTGGNYSNQSHHSTAITYVFVPYTFSALGILFARIFNGSLITQFYFGRLFNLIIYSIVGYFALKKMPKCAFRYILFFMMLLPLNIFQAASYSADVLTNCFAFLALSLTINMSFVKDKIDKKDILYLFLSCALCTMAKVPYFPIFLLFLMIPKEKFENGKKDKIKYSSIAIIMSLFLFGICSLYSSKLGLMQWPIEGADVKQQLFHIIKNPFGYAKVLFDTLNGQLNNLLYTLVSLAYNGILGHVYYYVVILTLFYLALIKNDYKFNIFQKIILLLISILCFGCAISTLYLTFNPVGAPTVNGFQGRYLVPIILPLLMLFNTKNGIKINDEKTKKYLYITSIVLLIVSINLIMVRFYM